MLTRDEAIKIANDMDYTDDLITSQAVNILINQIYNSIGTCSTCKKYINGSCIIPKLEHRYERADTFYCADIKD